MGYGNDTAAKPGETVGFHDQFVDTWRYPLYNQVETPRLPACMASKQQLREGEMTPETAGEIGEQAMGPAFLASAASVGLSLYYYFLRGNRELGTFVGLWPPTILAFASYAKQRKMAQQLEMITRPGTTIRDALETVMGNR